MRFSFIVFFSLVSFWFTHLQAQPNTEIYLFDLIKNGDSYSIANPINVSKQNPGYDNQPHFTDRGSLLFSSSRNGNTEVIEYHLATNQEENLSQSIANEYSPTPTPDGLGFSCIYDTTQNLVQYNFKSRDTTVLINNAVVGYHAWLNKEELILFVLGSPNTLQRYHLPTKKATVIDSTIGRSLHKIPVTNSYSYVDRKMQPNMIMKRSILGNIPSKLISLPSDTEDITWSPNGELISSNGSKVLLANLVEQKWMEIADLKTFNLSGITRLCVNKSGDKIAIVVNE
jgi:hypothetical protein